MAAEPVKNKQILIVPKRFRRQLQGADKRPAKGKNEDNICRVEMDLTNLT